MTAYEAQAANLTLYKQYNTYLQILTFTCLLWKPRLVTSLTSRSPTFCTNF